MGLKHLILAAAAMAPVAMAQVNAYGQCMYECSLSDFSSKPIAQAAVLDTRGPRPALLDTPALTATTTTLNVSLAPQLGRLLRLLRPPPLQLREPPQ
jgi:hypothetical protein